MTSTTIRQRLVYNLEFPGYCDSFSIDGYVFRRAPDYQAQFRLLHHVIRFFHEFQVETTLGTHACTCIVELPAKQKKPVIAWINDQEKPTALDDILLLLSLFTGRDVFSAPKLIGGDGSFTNMDPRAYYYDLRTDIPYEDDESKPPPRTDIGFEKGMNEVYALMRTAAWQQQYANGRFLPLFRTACRRNIFETSFITCWTIWEHLFALHNQKWMSKEEIRRFPVAEKISYVTVQYRIKDALKGKDREGIKRFATIRHTLVHAGRFPDRAAIKDADLFIRVTCMIVAKILGRSSPDVLSAQYRFNERLAGRRIQ
ncbi:MAG: hypothetical protein V1873_07365 [Verrucomicrobiota bacterium]